MRIQFAAALIAIASGTAFAEEAECTTTTTTTCKGAAAHLAVPSAEVDAPVPVYAPAPMPYAPPPGYTAPPAYVPPGKSHTELEPRYGLVIPGAAIFGASYMMNLLVAYAADEGRLAIPIIGPLLVGNSVTGDSGDRSFMTLMVFDTLVQATGAVLFVAGLVCRREVTVYDKVAIVPTASSSGAGLAAIGHF